MCFFFLSSSKPPIILGLNFLCAQYRFFSIVFVHDHFIWNGFLHCVFILSCTCSRDLSLLCYLQMVFITRMVFYFLLLHSRIIAASVYLLGLSSDLPYAPKFLLYAYTCKRFIFVLYVTTIHLVSTF